MLSIGKLAGGQEEYYLSAVAAGVEDYYLGAREAPGEWLGGGAARLGLAGQVEGDALRAVLDGRRPRTVASLIRHCRTDRVPGFDLTFSAPKGVSLLFALGDSPVAAAVQAGHDEAVRQAIGYLEREAGEVRRGRDGRVRLGGGGFVAAAFRHRCSRAGDPQLHTHVLVANMTQGVDGRWSALDGRQLYLQAKTAGCLYQAVLRRQLAPLGLAWVVRDNGLSELAGIPAGVLRAFSRRRVEIELRMRETGVTSRAGAQVATLDTRRAKRHDIDVVSMVAGWHARAERLGFDAAARRGLLETRAVLPPDPAELVRAAAEMLAETGLTLRTSTFTRKEVLQGWCRAIPDGAGVAELERLADRLLVGDVVIALDPPPVRTANHGGGAARSARRYSTGDLLAVEADLLARAGAAGTAGLAIAPQAAVAQAQGNYPELSREQQAMVDRLLSSGAGVEVVVGKAGAGKTTALAAARAGWQAAGIPVVGTAVAARAALALTDGTGIPAGTIAQLLRRARARPERALPAGGVLVVDEAGMLGTRDLARLLSLTQAVATKLVLVGDHRQLPELTAGGAFRALARTLPVIELRDNRRQHEGWERDALDELRHGDPDAALHAYLEHGRVHTLANADDARAQLVTAWWRVAGQPSPPIGAPAEPSCAGDWLDPDVVMLALRRADVAELNLRARTQLRAAGLLEAAELTVPTGPYAERAFAVGDLVLARRNAYSLGLINGTRGMVTAIDLASRQLNVAFPGRHVLVPSDYLAAGGLDHGYALTVHQAQGLTTRAAYLAAGDELYRQAGYVACSRARAGTHLYLNGSPVQRETEHEDCHGVRQKDPVEPLAGLRTALTRSKAQELAVELMG